MLKEKNKDVSRYPFHIKELYSELNRSRAEKKTETENAESKPQNDTKDTYKEAVEQGLAELGVPEGTASPDSLFLTELVEKNCSQPDKAKAPPAAAEIQSATKTPEIPRMNAQEKHK